jgi:hypothetical protein
MYTDQEIKKGLQQAYKEAGDNAYFGNGFHAGVDFVVKDSGRTESTVGMNLVGKRNHCKDPELIAHFDAILKSYFLTEEEFKEYAK